MISIVTVNFNNKDGLEKTLNSISKQKIEKNLLQLIVIDGGSKDGSVNIINQYKDIIDYKCSESDDGIFYGMNKGLSFCKGSHVIFMNSGDFFYDDDVLDKVFKNIEKNREALFWGKVIIDNKKSYPKSNNIKKTKFDIYKMKIPNHQGVFFPISFYSINQYNVNYRIASDTEYKIKALFDVNNIELPFFIASIDSFGVSNDLGTIEKVKIITTELNRVYNSLELKKIFIVKMYINYYIKFLMRKIL